MKIILAYITVMITAFAAFGHQPADSAKVYYRIGQSRLDPSFADNRRVLEVFESQVAKAATEHTLDSIVIRGYTSPEGVSTANMRLSELRCNAIKDYLTASAGVEPGKIRTYPEGVAWEGLLALVEANPEVPKRDEVMRILKNVPIWVYGAGGKIVDGKKKRLMSLDGGVPYRWMETHLFPELRKGVAVAFYFRPEPEAGIDDQKEVKEEVWLPVEENQTDVFEEIVECQPDSMPIMPEPPVFTPDSIKPERKWHFPIAVRTNMLFDALLVPNLAVEFGFGRHVSLYAEWMYAWWDSNRNHRYWRTYGGDVGFRWWFGRKMIDDDPRLLSGHHIGVYGGIMTFDFELGGTGYMGGKPGGTLWDRYLTVGGIEYGYSHSIAKCLRIDFSIGIGYLGGKYIKYYPFDNDYYFDKEYRMHYFGPTKAEISLVWLIQGGKPKTRKGGEE